MKVSKPKSPFEGLAVTMKKLDPDDIKRIMDESLKEIQEREKKEDEPPTYPTGKCVVCGDKVQAKVVRESNIDYDRIPLGPASKNYYHWEFKGYHCVGCGIKYETLPKQKQKA